jgi:hypothetical protein
VVNKAYDEAFKLRVLAIASVRGLSHACRQFGVDHETVRAWQAERGDDDKLKLAADLALSELTVEIAEGRNRGRLSTHAGILMDKMSRYYRPKPPETPATSVEKLIDRTEVTIAKLYPGDERRQDLALLAILDAPGDDIAVFEDPTAYLKSLGDLDAWHERRQAEDHAAMERQLEINRTAAAAAALAVLAAEDRALVEAAERWLAETAP